MTAIASRHPVFLEDIPEFYVWLGQNVAQTCSVLLSLLTLTSRHSESISLSVKKVQQPSPGEKKEAIWDHSAAIPDVSHVLIWNIGGFCILTWYNTIKQSGAIISSVLKTSEVPKDPHACFIRHRICRKASGKACLEMKQPPNFSLLSSDFFEGSYRTKRERPVGSTLSGGVKHMACRSDMTWALPGSGMLH